MKTLLMIMGLLVVASTAQAASYQCEGVRVEVGAGSLRVAGATLPYYLTAEHGTAIDTVTYQGAQGEATVYYAHDLEGLAVSLDYRTAAGVVVADGAQCQRLK